MTHGFNSVESYAGMYSWSGDCLLVWRISSGRYPVYNSRTRLGNQNRAIQPLAGQIVKRGGLGDNSAKVSKAKQFRIREGTYRLSTLLLQRNIRRLALPGSSWIAHASAIV